MIRESSWGSRMFDIFNYILMIVLSIVFFVPYWHLICASISEPWEVTTQTGLIIWPLGKINFEGYRLLLKNNSIQLGYLNTIIYVIGVTILGTILTTVAGFVLSRKNVKLNKFFAAFIMFTLLFNGGLIPTYLYGYKKFRVNWHKVGNNNPGMH